MTRKLYYASPGLVTTARVMRIDSTSGLVVFLDQTIFHPQGGGQKGDAGTIGGHRVIKVTKADGDEVAHSIDPAAKLAVGDTVELAVDEASRKLHSRLHTAGHLIAAVGERVIPGARGVAGHHWPGEARVEFSMGDGTLPDGLAPALQAKVAEAIQTDAAIHATDGSAGVRLVSIEGFNQMPCGGTHVARLKEIGGVVIRNAQLKKGMLRVGYDVA